jgi:hypothetical protein
MPAHYLFDLLELDGNDLRPRRLLERKRALRGAISIGGRIRFTPHRVGDAFVPTATPARRVGKGSWPSAQIARTGRAALATGSRSNAAAARSS